MPADDPDDLLSQPVPEPHPILLAPVPDPPHPALSAPVPEPRVEQTHAARENSIPLGPPSPVPEGYGTVLRQWPAESGLSRFDKAKANAPTDDLQTGLFSGGGAPVPATELNMSEGERNLLNAPVPEAPPGPGLTTLANKVRPDTSAADDIDAIGKALDGAVGADIAGKVMTAWNTPMRGIQTVLNQVIPDQRPMPEIFQPKLESFDAYKAREDARAKAWRDERQMGTTKPLGVLGTLDAAGHNMFVNPDDAPEFGHVVNKVLPSAVQLHADLTGDKSKTMFDSKQELKPAQTFAQALDFARDMYLMGKIDPMMRLHPGVSEAGQAEQAARSAAVADLSAGKSPLQTAANYVRETGKMPESGLRAFGNMNEAEMNAFAKPSAAAKAAAGQLGIGFTGYGPVPKFFLDINPNLAPAFKIIEPIFDMLSRPVVGESARSPNQIRQKVNEGEAHAAVAGFLRSEITPIEQQVQRAGLTPESMPHIGAAAEAFDEDGTLRAGGDANAFPSRYADRLNTRSADVVEATKKAYDSGAEHFTPQVQSAFEHASALNPQQQAAFWEATRKVAALPAKIRAFTESQGIRGFTTPELNGEIKAVPGKILDAIDAISERRGQIVPGPGAKVSPRLKGLFDKAIGGSELAPAELESLLSELRNEKPRPVEPEPFVKDADGNWVPAPPSVDVPKDALSLRDELLSRRAEKNDAAWRAKQGMRPDGTARNYLNQLSGDELTQLENALDKQLPAAMKRYNGVANYRPGIISEFTREQLDTAENKNLRRPGAPLSPEDMQRGKRLADLDVKYEDMGDVKATVAEQSAAYAKGTAATSGNATVAKPTLYERFMKPGWTAEIQEAAGKAFMEPDPIKAFRRHLETNDYKTLANRGVENAVANTYDILPLDLVQKAQQLLYRGVEDGGILDKTETFKTGGPGRTLRAEPSMRGNGFDRKNLPPWEYVVKNPQPEALPNTHDPFTQRTYPGQARFQNMEWDELTKLADEGNPAARHEVAMRMEPLSGRSSGRPEMKPNRVAGVAPWEMGDAPPSERMSSGRVYDPQNPFEPRTEPFARDTGVDHGPWRSGMPGQGPADWFKPDEPPAAPAPAAPPWFNEPPIEGAGPERAQAWIERERASRAKSMPAFPESTQPVDPFAKNATQWHSYPAMDWKALGERARNGDLAAQQEMSRRTEPRSFRSGDNVDPNLMAIRRSPNTEEGPATRAQWVKSQQDEINAMFRANKAARFDPLRENPFAFEKRTPGELEAQPAGAAPVFEGKQALERGRRPATLDDLEQLWKGSGRRDTFAENLNAKARQALADGKTLQQAVDGKSWQPADRNYVELGDQKGYLHAGVERELSEYKRLGNDPTRISNWINTNVPIYAWALQQSKKFGTAIGPQFPAYMLMKQLHDQVRAFVGGVTDAQYPLEVVRGQAGHFDYAQNHSTALIPEYNFGPYGRLRGDQAAQLLERIGILDRGTEMGEYTREAADPNVARGYLAGRVDKAKAMMKDARDTITGQDNANRAAAFAARLRAGDTPFEAAYRVNNAMFDFSRRGAATQVAATSGLIPFAGWHAKVIPFMARWAFENPGQFMLVQKTLQQAQANMIPSSQLPDYMRAKTNIPVHVYTDENGHTQMTLISDQGVIPGADLTTLAKSMLDDGENGIVPGWSWLKGHSGPALRMLFELKQMRDEAGKDPDGKTPIDRAETLANNSIWQRPIQGIKDLTDPKKQTGGDMFNAVLNPTQAPTLDMTKQGQISKSIANKNLTRAQYQAGDANRALDAARDAFVAKHTEYLEADALKMADDDPIVVKAMQALSDARATVAREQARLKQTNIERQRAGKLLERFQRAP